MFPNTAAEKGTPAINEPHEADSGVTVQRRAEDLSGKEVAKGKSTLIQYGHDPKDPMESLREVHRKALDHVSAQHIAAGVNESSSQMFYGGSTNTDLPHDVGAQSAHEEGVMAARDRFSEGVRHLATHPGFQAETAHLSHRERMHAATNLMAQASADTSPNTKWRDKPGAKYPWPNMDQAEEASTAAIEKREPKFISGRIGNVYKASNRVGEAIDSKDYSVHQHGDPVSAPKTMAFRGALVDKDSPDAYKVTDVHEASVVAPWLSTAKSHMHERLDDQGERVGHKIPVYADTPKKDRAGLRMLTKTTGAQGGVQKQVPEWGLSRPEAMLSEGRSTVHALNDRATREVLTERGLSRSVDHADNVHSMQGAAWGMQQLRRQDVNVSPADQYPVVRHWEHEGANVPANGDIRNLPHSSSTNLSPQFGKNDRTGRTQSIWPEQH
jgi:ketosteroid isomerase-like protein